MSMSAWKRAGVSLAAVAVIAGVAGCQDGDGKAAGKSAGEQVAQTRDEMNKVIQAAFRKTSDAKSARVKMTMDMNIPGSPEGNGTMEMSGIQGWDPAAMDITMKGSALAAGKPDGPKEMRMIMLDQVMYMDMGAKQAAQMDGKRWMKMDLKALAEQSGDPAMQKQMTGGLENMNQDPAQQLALLVESPNLKHIGSEKIDGVETEHYKGTLTFEQMLNANKQSELLTAKERDSLVANMKKMGLKGYDTELWVNEDGYPARMVVGMTMAQGTMKMRADYSDYGAKATVQAPPAKDTLDLFEMLKGLKGGAEQG
ncbi:hypothetical protein ACFU3J_21100 [Streptomyces sp. NPDC057411]|uniref:hypothetical protein n=1 Tax=unclassified Streptomyces TaxID=2593676 RepID=UPI00363F25C0